jgi:[acyl-carrier-protein] S-malonyltransferase
MLAFLFPGQGSQQAGMGAALLRVPEIGELAERCSQAAGVDLCRLLTEADDSELKLTTNAQPTLLFVGVALSLLLARRGVRPAAAAGHSLGEYTALCVAGAMEPEDAVRAVAERARAQAAAAPPGSSSMMAVLGLPPEGVVAALDGLCEVWPANFNTPSQTVIGGTMEGLRLAADRLRRAGAKRVLPLNVAAAFHTPLMAAAGSTLRGVLETVAWRAPGVPVVANVDGTPYRTAAEIPDVLERQLSSPVRWVECVARLGELGCDRYYELGPGRALTGMMRELAPGAAVLSVSSPEAAEQVQ